MKQIILINNKIYSYKSANKLKNALCACGRIVQTLKARVKRQVLSLVIKKFRVSDWRTYGLRSFQIWGPMTLKARSDKRLLERGTCKRWLEFERSVNCGEWVCRIFWRRHTMHRLVDHHSNSELDPIGDFQPMEMLKGWRYVLMSANTSQEVGCRVLYALQLCQLPLG